MAPLVAIPIGATLGLGSLTVVAQIDPDTVSGTTYPLDVLDDLVQITKSGVAVGSSIALLTKVSELDGTKTYSFDPVALGFSLADINGGLLGVQLGWKVDPPLATGGNTDPYAAANWSIGISPTSPQQTVGVPSVSVNLTYTVTATWIGAGPAPSYVILSLAGTATVLGPALICSLDNGLGATFTGATSGASASSTINRRVSTVAGVATSTVIMTGSASTGGLSVKITMTLTATIAQPNPTTLKVDVAMAAYNYIALPMQPMSIYPAFTLVTL